MSSTERQRRFRERNPGYDARRKAKQRASERAALQQFIAQQAAEAVRQAPLLLPAPAEPLVFEWSTDANVQRDVVCVEQRAA